MSNKAVILGCNYYIGLSVIRCLGEKGIHTVAVDYSEEFNYGSASKYCSESLIAPHYKEDQKGFVQFLKDYAEKQSETPVLFPCHDAYVEVIDAHLDELKQYYLLPDMEQGLYAELMNKEKLQKLAMEKGVLVPETVRINDENFYQKIEKEIQYPCIVKPVDSPTFVAKFRRKLFKVHNKAELDEALEKSREANLEVVVQRIIPGFDDHMHTFDAYLNKHSKVTHWVTCQKYRQYPINFGASVYTGQKYFPELYDIGAKFLEEIKYKGFAEIEFKKDSETGEFYLIEINVRTTNFNSLLHKVGFNFPYIAYRELTGSPMEPKALTENTNIVFRYTYEDMLAIKDYIKTKQLSLWEVFVSLFKRKAHAIWNWKDPKPAFSFLNMIFTKAFGKVFKRHR